MNKKKVEVTLSIEVDMADNIVPEDEFLDGVFDTFHPENTSHQLDNGFDYEILDCEVTLLDDDDDKTL